MSTKRKAAFEYGSLSEQEARERLALAKEDLTVVGEVYDFGKMLVSEAVTRASRLDTKYEGCM